MPEIDLIPNDYRGWLERRRLLVTYVVVFAVLNVTVVGASAWLSSRTNTAQQQIAKLRADNAITQQQHQQLESLKTQETEYQRQWSLLRGLRAGAAVEDIFAIVDNALAVGDLWFLDWSFRRAGVIVDGEQRGIETGYFIVVSADNDPKAKPEFEVETHMSIRGQARDHQALSRFVRALYTQDMIADVSVRKTSRSDYANGQVVDFDLTVVLNSAVKGS